MFKIVKVNNWFTNPEKCCFAICFSVCYKHTYSLVLYHKCFSLRVISLGVIHYTMYCNFLHLKNTNAKTLKFWCLPWKHTGRLLIEYPYSSNKRNFLAQSPSLRKYRCPKIQQGWESFDYGPWAYYIFKVYPSHAPMFLHGQMMRSQMRFPSLFFFE